MEIYESGQPLMVSGPVAAWDAPASGVRSQPSTHRDGSIVPPYGDVSMRTSAWPAVTRSSMRDRQSATVPPARTPAACRWVWRSVTRVRRVAQVVWLAEGQAALVVGSGQEEVVHPRAVRRDRPFG